MKLIYCRECGHVLSLTDKRWRSCDCGQCGGRYLSDLLHAEIYGGDACVPLGFNNPEFRLARRLQPESGWGERFEAFVIPVNCPTVRRRRRPKKHMTA
jgi:hypothetical protein